MSFNNNRSRSSRRIDRGGRDWIAPTHLSDWQRDRATAWAPEARWSLFAIVVSCVAVWLVLSAFVLIVAAVLS